MNKRILVCGLALGMAAVASLPTINRSTAQDYPTANASTIDAMVQQRFQATAYYSGFGTLNATIDAVFIQAQTATSVAQTATTAGIGTPTATLPPPTLNTTPIVANDAVALPGNLAFQMGTTLTEIATAVNQCTVDEGGNCTTDMAQDSLPAHTVELSPFQMQRHEVTVTEYTTFLNTLGPRGHLTACDGETCALTQVEDASSPIAFDGKTYSNVNNNVPMYKVTWYGAKTYCESIGGRLPTEAEWEYAARGTDGRIYPWGNNWDPLNARTSLSPAASVGPSPILSYPSGASAFGIYDMAGNVAEWVSDWYDPAYYSTPEASSKDPQGPTLGSEKVIRGGSWDSKPFFARTVHRQSLAPDSTTNATGFRCAFNATPGMIPAPTLTSAFTLAPSPSSQANLVVSPTAAATNAQSQPTAAATNPQPTTAATTAQPAVTVTAAG